MRFRETKFSERTNCLYDFFLCFSRDTFPLHPGTQFNDDLLHAFFGALETEGATQFLCLTTRKIGDFHRHSQKLFLKQWNSQRAPQYFFQRGMQWYSVFSSLPAFQIWVRHLTFNRTRPDD